MAWVDHFLTKWKEHWNGFSQNQRHGGSFRNAPGVAEHIGFLSA